jgi:hypothetical protein
MITDELPEGLDYVRFGEPQAPGETVMQLVAGGYKLAQSGRGVVVKVKAGYQLAYDAATDTNTVDKDFATPQTVTVTLTLKSVRQKAQLTNALKVLQKNGIPAQIVP